MIDWTASHISFVITAYAIVFAVLAIVVAATLMRASSLRKTLKAMNLPDTGEKDQA
jgi:heme exporter protein CcmD